MLERPNSVCFIAAGIDFYAHCHNPAFLWQPCTVYFLYFVGTLFTLFHE